MRKIVAAINMSVDGYCDHTAMNADDELHEHYSELLRNAGALLYGRITYQLMESYWPTVVNTPTGNTATDEFAVLIDKVPKIVYSRTLKSVEWNNTQLKNEVNREEVLQLKQQDGKDMYVGSPSLIVALSNLDVVDGFQLCVHPVILGNGLPLFKNITNSIDLTLIDTKTFSSGSIVLYYERHRA